MKVKTLSILAGAGSLLIAGTAQAAFTGLSVELTSQQAATGAGPSAGWGASQTYVIYANFSETAIVTGVTGASMNFVGGPVGANGNQFFKQAFAYGAQHSNVSHPGGTPVDGGLAVDTFATIGALFGTGNPSLNFTPDFLGPGTGLGTTSSIAGGGSPFANAWDGAGAGEGWFTANPAQSVLQGTKVAIFQVTVAANSDFSEFGIFEFTGGIGTANLGNFNETTVTNAVAVPAPGALALLGLAGLAGVRRRRN